MLLDWCCSIPVPSVFSHTKELVARLPGMNHGVLSACTPYSWLPHRQALSTPAPTWKHSPKKAKNAQSPLKSVLCPPVILPQPSSPLSARSSCLPLLPTGGAQSLSGLKHFHPPQVSGSRTEPLFPVGALVVQVWQPRASLVPSLPGLNSHSDSHGLPWAVFIVCWAKNKSPKCWVP